MTITVALLAILGGPAAIAYWGLRLSGMAPLATHLTCQGALVGLATVTTWMCVTGLRMSATDLGFVGVRTTTFLWALLIATLFISVVGPALIKLPGRLGFGSFEPGLAQLSSLPHWSLALAVIVGGIAEELLYRGIALPILSDLMGSHLLAAGAVVIAFATAHLPFWGLGPSLTFLISGSVFTAFYVLHGDLVANMLAHIAVDLVGLVGAPGLRSR